MTNISLRLPDELAEKLDRETRESRRGRSEIVREALDRYLAEKARERLMREIVREARAVYGDPERRAEAEELAEALLPAENEALDGAEGSGPEPIGEKWWK